MTEQTSADRLDLIGMAGDIVGAYVSNNHVARADLPALIGDVHAAITAAATGAPAVAIEAVEKPTPAQTKRSITHDGITSFIDGRVYKTLKRHLTSHGFTPERYRECYGLPADYPMVCRSYSEQRSSLAKSSGLGVPGGRIARGGPNIGATAEPASGRRGRKATEARAA